MNVLKYIWYYFKHAGTILVINFLFGITMFLVFAIKTIVLRNVIVFAMLAALFVLDFFIMRSTGEQDFAMRVVGDAKRKNKPTGKPEGKSTHHVSKEYKVYKGFIIGLIVILPGVLLTLIAELTGSAGVLLAQMVAFGWQCFPVRAISVNANLFFSFIVMALSVAIIGFSYIIGGEKGRLQHNILLKKTNAISEMEKNK